MKHKIMFWLLLALVVSLSTGCSTDNNNGTGQSNPLKPPQVRVESLPTATFPPAPPQALAPTLEPSPTATQVQVLYYDPTPDEAALMSDIEARMDYLDRQLQNQNFNLKP